MPQKKPRFSVQRFLKEWSELGRLKKLPSREKRIVVYAESESQWHYFGPIIDAVKKNHGFGVVYVTSSELDPKLDNPLQGMQSFYIGSGTVRTIAFATLEAEIVLMTTPGLETTHIKRSKHPVHYIYTPHNMNSTHMVFSRGAFDGFDSIFCVGPHQKRELLEAEALYNLKPRNLVETGYVPLDSIIERAPGQSEAKKYLTVMIAPTWGAKALLRYGCEPMIESLLDGGHKVIIRPHRDSELQDADVIEALDAQFGSVGNFHWAENLTYEQSFLAADLLITDWSGAAFSFAFGLGRPVLSVDVPTKIQNRDFARFKSVPLEIELREKLGGVLAPEEMGNACAYVEKLCRNPEQTANNLDGLRRKSVYRLGDSALFSAGYIADLLRRKGRA